MFLSTETGMLGHICYFLKAVYFRFDNPMGSSYFSQLGAAGHGLLWR